jgi:hypothetical protein
VSSSLPTRPAELGAQKAAKPHPILVTWHACFPLRAAVTGASSTRVWRREEKGRHHAPSWNCRIKKNYRKLGVGGHSLSSDCHLDNRICPPRMGGVLETLPPLGKGSACNQTCAPSIIRGFPRCTRRCSGQHRFRWLDKGLGNVAPPGVL